jgi:predicted transposase YdaD
MTTYKRIINKGVEQGAERETERYVINFLKKGNNVEQIASLLELPLEKVRSIIEKYLKSQGHGS